MVVSFARFSRDFLLEFSILNILSSVSGSREVSELWSKESCGHVDEDLDVVGIDWQMTREAVGPSLVIADMGNIYGISFLTPYDHTLAQFFKARGAT
ncbi:hypothetical protein N7504_005288 [Penicillium tannophilum]|nr:hypothetical protein N7504_005288 [Penicillium tannophilum]